MADVMGVMLTADVGIDTIRNVGVFRNGPIAKW